MPKIQELTCSKLPPPAELEKYKSRSIQELDRASERVATQLKKVLARQQEGIRPVREF